MTPHTSPAAAGASATTWLFVPGDRPERFDKAASAGADVVVLDLEDAVAPDSRPAAREAVATWLPGATVPCAVRVNAGADRAVDVAALAGLGPVLVVVAKAEDPTDVTDLLDALAPGSGAVALVESARGVLAATDLAAVPGVVRLALGTFDLAAELGVDPDHGPALAPARGALVLASAAGGLAGPVDGVTGSVHDTDLITADTDTARRLGFAGKLCIHPGQVPVVRAALAPDEAEIARAERVVAAAGGDAVAVVDGRMVDKPVVERARRALAAAEAARGEGHR